MSPLSPYSFSWNPQVSVQEAIGVFRGRVKLDRGFNLAAAYSRDIGFRHLGTLRVEFAMKPALWCSVRRKSGVISCVGICLLEMVEKPGGM